MDKKKQKRKKGECTCDNCGIMFKKPQSEINRNLNICRKNYCTRSCAGFANIKNFGNKSASYDISKHSKNKIDEFTPFKYHYRNWKKRYKEVEVDLKYLKKIWDEQNGICPFSGIKLILSSYTKILKDPRYAASLDRIDSKKEYIVGNIRWVSRSINLLKNDMDDNSLKEFLELISEHYKKQKGQ